MNMIYYAHALADTHTNTHRLVQTYKTLNHTCMSFAKQQYNTLLRFGLAIDYFDQYMHGRLQRATIFTQRWSVCILSVSRG
jgi:hypothetical protein